MPRWRCRSLIPSSSAIINEVSTRRAISRASLASEEQPADGVIQVGWPVTHAAHEVALDSPSPRQNWTKLSRNALAAA